MAKRRVKRRSTSGKVSVKGYTKIVKGKRVRVSGYRRKK